MKNICTKFAELADKTGQHWVIKSDWLQAQPGG
jgi:hypothetical protein